MPIPSKKYLHFMLYISSIFLVTSPLSVGHPAPPSTPLVRPRTAVCSRGARARRERSGSVAEADGYSGAHRAAAPPCPSSARHVQPCRSRGRSTLPFISAAPRTCSGKNSHQQPLTPRCSPLTACRAIPRGTWRGAPPTPLHAPMHSVPCHAPLRARARGTPLQAPMHSVLCPTPLRARARGTPLQAPMHSALYPAPLRAPQIALHSAGVTRLEITPALAGAMRMSAKPPLRLPWRGLNPRGRDTPASLRAGRARARPGGGTPLRRAQHYAHGSLPFRFGGTRAPLRRAQHYAHGHLPFRFGGTRAPLRMARHYAHGHMEWSGGSTPPCATWNSTADW